MDNNFEKQEIKFGRLRAIWRLFFFLLIGIPALLLVLGLSWLFTLANDIYSQIIGWFGVALSGLALLLVPIVCGWLLLQILFPYREYILLDSQGFTIHGLRYTFFQKWSDVGKFSIRWGHYGFSFVVFDYFPSVGGTSQKGTKIKKGAILNQYQIGVKPLAELLNSWRDHHTHLLNK